MRERGLIMKLSLLALVVVAIVTFLTTATLFFILRMRDKNLYLSKFTACTGRPTIILLIILWLEMLIGSSLDLFFISWPLIGSAALLSMACIVGSLPAWIIVAILYVIKINRTDDNSTNNDNTETKPKQTKSRKEKKNISLFGGISIATYFGGFVIQTMEHYPIETGKRNVIAAILLAISIITYLIVLYKGKAKKTQKT